MLRRILGFTFALLLFALAFSIPDRTTAPGDLISAQSESPGLIVAALFLPQTAIAQTPATAPGQTVADTSARAAPVDAGRSPALLWGTLALVAVLIAGAWFVAKRSRNDASGGGYASGSSGPSTRPQRPSAT